MQLKNHYNMKENERGDGMNRKERYRTDCLCLQTSRLSWNVTEFYDRMISEAGVTARQRYLLSSIGKAGKCSIRELADITEYDRSTLARTLKPLLSRGLVVDMRAPGTRNHQLELTEEGWKVENHALELWDEAQSMVEKTLGEDGMAAFELIVSRFSKLGSDDAVSIGEER